MKFLIATAILYCTIAAPTLMAMGRIKEASVHMIAVALAYAYWNRHES